MPLNSPRFAWNLRLQSAYNNSPPLHYGDNGEDVRLIQQALIDLGYPMPVSTQRYGSPDGIYGNETVAKLQQFQRAQHIAADGIAGHDTLGKLDTLLPNAAPRLPALPAPEMYLVPGMRVLIAQPSNQVCWATVHCMMRSWKDQSSYNIRDAAARAGEKYGVMVDQNKGMPPGEFKAFIRAAGMRLEPMANLTIQGWVDKLKAYGLLWVGTLFSESSGLHSRIIEGVTGGGGDQDTWMMMMDPWGGVRYREPFSLFLHKYEEAFMQNNTEYYQIRHF
jgi:hypothetical protein